MVIEALKWGRRFGDQIIHGPCGWKTTEKRDRIKVLGKNSPTDSAEEAIFSGSQSESHDPGKRE